MSPLEIWCNEAQERYVLAVAAADLERFREICARERCPFAVVGEATAEPHLHLADSEFHNAPIDLPMDVLFGKPPKMHRDVRSVDTALQPVVTGDIDLEEAVDRVLADIEFFADSAFAKAGGRPGQDFALAFGQQDIGRLFTRLTVVESFQGDIEMMAVGLSGDSVN